MSERRRALGTSTRANATAAAAVAAATAPLQAVKSARAVAKPASKPAARSKQQQSQQPQQPEQPEAPAADLLPPSHGATAVAAPLIPVDAAADENAPPPSAAAVKPVDAVPVVLEAAPPAQTRGRSGVAKGGKPVVYEGAAMSATTTTTTTTTTRSRRGEKAAGLAIPAVAVAAAAPKRATRGRVAAAGAGASTAAAAAAARPDVAVVAARDVEAEARAEEEGEEEPAEVDEGGEEDMVEADVDEAPMSSGASTPSTPIVRGKGRKGARGEPRREAAVEQVEEEKDGAGAVSTPGTMRQVEAITAQMAEGLGMESTTTTPVRPTRGREAKGRAKTVPSDERLVAAPAAVEPAAKKGGSRGKGGASALAADSVDVPRSAEAAGHVGPEIQPKAEAEEEKRRRPELPVMKGRSGVYLVGSMDNVGFPIGEDVFEATVLTRIESLPSDTVGFVAAGSQHAVIVSSDGKTVWSFGNNDEGALGRDTDGDSNEEQQLKPVPLPPLKFVKVACSDNMTAFLSSDGAVYSCGTFKNSDGENHYSETLERQPVPSLVKAFNEPVVDIAAGANFLLAVTKSGELFAWGEGKHGQLGHETRTRAQQQTRNPYRLSVSDPLAKRASRVTFRRVFAGPDTAFGIDEHGRVFAFGSSNWGQLGLGRSDVIVQPLPTLVRHFVDAGIRVEAVASGSCHTLFLTTEGAVYACGRDDEGQLGAGRTMGRRALAPVRINPVDVEFGGEGGKKVVSIACGLDHSAAIDEAGQLWTWGWGEGWMLGTGRQRSEAVPRRCGWVARPTGGAEAPAARLQSMKAERVVAAGNFTMVVASAG